MTRPAVKTLASLVVAVVAVAICAGLLWQVDAAGAAAGSNGLSAQTDQASMLSLQAKKAKKTKKYPIVYKLNGGKQNARQTLKIAAGKEFDVSKLKKPKRTGYLFMGWYTNSKLTKKATVVKGVAQKSKRTLYAKWVKIATYKISYKLNGGKLYGTYVKKFKNTKAVTKLPSPKRTGYTFAGWYSNKKLTAKATKIAKAVTKNQTLYAKWTPIDYSIAYVLDGGTLPEGHVTSYNIEKGVKDLPIPVKEGYSFVGWWSNAKLTKPVSAISVGERGNKVLYAKWEKRVLVAHRGLHSQESPENSVASFRDAAARGFTEVETDVRFTSDGVPVLVHNATVPVIGELDGVETVMKREISSFTYEELQNATLNVAKSGEDERNVATFEEGLAACADLGLRMTIHLKVTDEPSVQALIALVDQYQMMGNVCWFAAEIDPLRYINSGNPSATLSYSHSFTKAAVTDLLELKTSTNRVEMSTKYDNITASKTALLMYAGIPARTWTFDDEESITGVDQYVSTVLVDGLAADYMPELVNY